MNEKKFLKVAQAENRDEGKLSEFKNMTAVHYVMLLLAWLIVFAVRIFQNERTDDLFFMILFLALGHELYMLKKKISFVTIITVVILVIATVMTGWSLLSVLFV
ncbi:DUF6442 family protein [Leuconostoc mesenteroides]|uniref:DUF6442 family protein n=1 Tax=Leuconostoc mesenteroides TaxID=1245 RepID=UPI001CBF59F1|nr:DUF6442 family protein [Leuconostoc mesenteroides]MBZ1533891.1 hypothetical protein [Leuconostoc mesenteroides]